MSIAEDILDGIFCDSCGVFVGEPIGYVRKCEECSEEVENDLGDE